MSRIYVDRISPYQSGSVQVDGLNLDTGSLTTKAEFNDYTASAPTTGSNTFQGNQTVNGTITATSTISDTISYPTPGAPIFTTNFSNVSATNGASFPTAFEGVANLGTKDNNGITRVFSNPGQYFSTTVHGPQVFKATLQPTGSSVESKIELLDDDDGTTTLTLKGDNVVISGSVGINGSGFSFTQPYPSAFGTNPLEIYGSHTLDNGAVYGDVRRQQSNVQVALNGKINGWLSTFRENAVGASNYYSQEWIGPRYLAWEMRPSGSASESTISLFNADNNGTNVVATITADDVDINGPVTLDQTLKLEAQDPLPTGGTGQLAVSGSNLYYHNGSSWSQIN